jgi:hypothetical protein
VWIVTEDEEWQKPVKALKIAEEVKDAVMARRVQGVKPFEISGTNYINPLEEN